MGRKRTRKRRNLVIISIMLFGFIALIVAVNALSTRQTLILPELHAEKERLRLDPNQNAYYDIVDASRDIPYAPISKLVPDPWSDGGQMEYKPPRGSISDLMHIDRPLDDELTQQYILDTRYIVPIMDAACEKPNYVGQIESRLGSIPLLRETINPYRPMRLYMAHAFVEIQLNGDTERGLDILKRAYGFVVENGDSNYYRGNLQLFYRGIQYSYRILDDPILRQRLADFATGLPAPFRDWDRLLERNIGAVDETMLSPADYPHSIPLAVRFNLFTLRRTANEMRNALPQLREIARTHPLDWAPLIDEENWSKELFGGYTSREAWATVLSPFHAAHWQNAQHAAMPVILAMEDYYREHGEYPKTLNALVPGYIDEIPVSPYSRTRYRLRQDPRFLYLVEDWDDIPTSKNDLYYRRSGSYATFDLDKPEEA